MTALAVCRFAHFMAAMLAFGASAYLWLYAPDNLRRALSPAVRRLTITASLVALVSAFVWLSLEAASMADDWSAATDPEMVATVLTDTSFGHAWIARLVLAAALVVAVFARRDHWRTIAILSALLLASLALVGHAAMQTGAVGLLHRANHALHLLTTGAWLGGLVAFVLCLREYADTERRREAVDAMMRFSFFGHFVVSSDRRDGGRQYRADLRPRALAANDALPRVARRQNRHRRGDDRACRLQSLRARAAAQQKSVGAGRAARDERD